VCVSVCVCGGGSFHYSINAQYTVYWQYSWGPNFVLFILSLSERKFNTRNIRYDGCFFLCKMDRMKVKHTNQLEIPQNEIWTQRKFPELVLM